MKLIFAFVMLSCSVLFGQESVDGNFDFQTENNKKYNLYIPSDYQPGNPHQLMLGLHPLNTSRWDAESWRDTLIAFAESNSLILVCPDGGADGRIDDPIDTAFTSVLLDSMMHWYSVDEENMYIMGFSWGGKTTYSYGLRRAHKFRGFMPIGAAISGASEFQSVIANATNNAFYLIHGSQDSPTNRYTPMLNALTNAGACVEGVLMNGVGHTIDFPNRNQILTDGFNWLKSQNCGMSAVETHERILFNIEPNPVMDKLNISVDNHDIELIQIININGEVIMETKSTSQLNVENLNPGIYLISIQDKNGATGSQSFIKM